MVSATLALPLLKLEPLAATTGSPEAEPKRNIPAPVWPYRSMPSDCCSLVCKPTASAICPSRLRASVMSVL